MNLTLHVRVDKLEIHNHGATSAQLDAIFERLNLMVTKAEFAADVEATTALLNEAFAEITAKLAELEAAIGNGDVPQEVTDAFTNLKAAVRPLADIVPGGS